MDAVETIQLEQALPGVTIPPYEPVMHKIILMVEAKQEQINGLFVPEATAEREQLGSQNCTIVKLGPTAFDHARASCLELGIEADWPRVGDKVHIVKYAGSEFEHEGQLFRYVNDEDILGFDHD